MSTTVRPDVAAAPEGPLEIDWDDPSFRDDPHPLIRELRAREPVGRTPDGSWRLLRYDDVVRLLRDVPSGVRLSDGSLPGRDRPEIGRAHV